MLQSIDPSHINFTKLSNASFFKYDFFCSTKCLLDNVLTICKYISGFSKINLTLHSNIKTQYIGTQLCKILCTIALKSTKGCENWCILVENFYNYTLKAKTNQYYKELFPSQSSSLPSLHPKSTLAYQFFNPLNLKM